MGTWQVPTAFVLFAQLLTLSTGNIDGTNEFEKNFSKNVSIVLIENKASEAVDETFRNESSLNPGYNFSMASDTINMTTTTTTTTMLPIYLETEKILEAELKEALDNASLTDQVIVISALETENSNSTVELLGPLILIESPVINSQASTIDYSSIDNDKKIIDNDSFDQEIAQSQTRTRSTIRDYEDDDYMENLQDLLAIADYEPQKIDAKRIERLNTQPSLDRTNDQLQSTTSQKPDETHYDVPKRVNSQRISEYQRPTTKTTFDEFSTYLPLTVTSSSSHQSEPDRKKSSFNSSDDNYKAERRKILSPLSFDRKKFTHARAELSREPRHLETVLPTLTTFTTTHVPGLPRAINENTKITKHNLTNIAESSSKNFRSFPSRNSWISLPFQPLGQDQTPFNKQENVFQTISTTTVIPLAANRRIDDYSSSGNPPNHQINPLANDQRLGFLTRYNLPSLVTGRISKPRPYKTPTLLYGQQTGSAENIQKEEVDKTENSSEEKISTSSRTNIPVEYSDEESEEKSQRISEKPFYVEDSRKNADRTEDTPIYDSYENEEETKASKSYEDEKIVRLASTTPLYESYEVYEKPERSESILRRENLNSRITEKPLVTNSHLDYPTKTIYHPYDYLGKASSSVTPINKLPNAESSLYSTISTNNVYDTYKNYPLTRTTTAPQTIKKPKSSYETYEDYEESPSVKRKNINNNSNWLDQRYENFKKSQNVPSVLTRKINDNYRDREKNRNDHSSKVTKKNVSSLPSTRVSFVNNPQRNLNPVVNLSSPDGHDEESPDYYNNERDEKIYASTSAKQRIQKTPHHYEEENNRAVISSTPEAPIYRSNEDNEQDYILSTSEAISTEPKSINYRNRLKPSMINENLTPHYHTRVSPVKSKKLPIYRNDNRRIVPAPIEHESVEYEKRADLEDPAAYKDEEPSASSGHEANHKIHAQSRKDDGGGDVKSEKGGGEKHQEAHHESHGEKGEKGYTNWHESDKGKKGHHDKEHKENEYDEKKGEKKEHEDMSGYHEESHHGEKGEKESAFGEKGHNEKGHSTKGTHVVHKKDEYEKKTEFYDESHEEDDNEKEGEYHYEHENKKGGHEKIGHHESEGHEDKYGEKGEHEKGQHYDETKGHEDKNGREQHHRHEAKYGKKGAHEEGEKWSHKKGDNRKR